MTVVRSGDQPFAGACDTHMHFYDSSYAASAEAVLFPPDATPGMYRSFQAELGLDRAVVVQPTTYGLDNRCQLDGMATLAGHIGQDNVRGVMVIDGSVDAHDIEVLHNRGVRGARFHMLPGGAVGWDDLGPVASKIADFGWHIQLQLNGRELHDRLDHLLGLPTDVVVDHVGRFMPPVGIDDQNYRALLTLVEAKGWVKLSAPYESSVGGPPTYADVAALTTPLIERFPDKLLWASNWPHPGQADPPKPSELAELRDSWILDPEFRRRILVDNPSKLYAFPSTYSSNTNTQTKDETS